MKLLGFLAALVMAGLALGPAGAATTYVLTIENPSSQSYHVEVRDNGTIHAFSLATDGSKSLSVASQTPRVSISGTGCSTSATPSIKTYVTLALRANCKIETKAAGVSGF